MVEIKRFQKRDTQQIIDLVLHCQNDGTRSLVNVDSQPYLQDIENHFFKKGGFFWVAKENESVAGTIALLDMGSRVALMKCFFTYETYRGYPHYLGKRLFSRLMDYAKIQDYKCICLTTPRNTERAHNFYLNAGFRKIPLSEMPCETVDPYEDLDCFILDL